MITNCLQISDVPQLSPCEYTFAVNAITKKKARIWIDVLDADTSDVEKILDDLNVKGLIKRYCLESHDHPGFYPLKPLSLMVVPVQIDEQDENKLDYMSLLISCDFLITFRKSNMARFQKDITIKETLELLPDSSIAGIFSTLLMGLSLDCLRKAAKLSDNIMALEEQMDREPTSVNIKDISAKRFDLLALESVVQGQLPIIEAIVTSNRYPITSDSTLEYLIWTAANLKSADRKLEWLEHIIEVMRSSIEAYGQEKTNRRLGRLTVLSMIFMPITFLAGVWGMNFEFMPLLSLKNGYLVALAVMIMISGGMYQYYRRKGWFK
ncbi:MAG: hypothetical protein E4G95_01785 [Bacteroidia bacterium]|nr:MAG: hypothetical protein E4G95_01785 [Bacteroidia bacterium]